MKSSRTVWLSISFAAMLGMGEVAHAASSAQVSWTVPTTRENGSTLAASDLSGYELYYTTDDPNVSGTIKVSGGSTSSYTVQNLAAGTYHFAISAVDVNGAKSQLSKVADLTLAAAAPSKPSSMTAAASSSTTSTSKSVKVSWVAPTTRTDGTSLSISELSGYKISLSSFGGGAVNVSVNGGSVNNYSVTNVGTGLYVAYLTAIDKTGKQSASTYQYVYVQ